MLLLLILAGCGDPPADSKGPETDTGDSNDTGDTADSGDSGDSGLELLDELDLAEALWGGSVGNTVKVYPSAWDEDAGLLYVTGIQVPNILVVDPAAGHPVDSFGYTLTGHHNPLLIGDFARRRLYFLARGNAGVIALDVDTQAEIWRNDAASEDGSSLESLAAPTAVVDPNDGTLYVLEQAAGRIQAYDADGVARTVPGPVAPSGLAGADDALYVFEGGDHTIWRYVPSTAEYTHFTDADEAPFGAMDVAEDGTLVVATASLVAYDTAGAERWRADPGGGPLDLVVAGDTVAETVSRVEAGYGEEANRLVQLYSLADGTRTDVEAEWGAELLSGGSDRIFVSNGSDGTVSMIEDDAIAATIPVANVPDTSVYDSITGTRYVLDRLGGSVIHAWASDGSVSTFDAGAWPTEVAIDVERRRLYASEHFSASVRVWDLDSLEEVGQLDLGVPANTSDTIGDFTVDVETGLGAVVYPETGSVVLFDLDPLAVRWSFTEPIFAMGTGAGAGTGFVAIDSAHDLLYLFVAAHATVEALSLVDGAGVATGALTSHDRLDYNLNSMFVDADGKLYLGEEVLQTPAMTWDHALEEQLRVLCRDGDTLYALRAADDGTEDLVTLDEAGVPTVVGTLGVTTGMRMETECDVETGTLTVSDLEQGRVRVLGLPAR